MLESVYFSPEELIVTLSGITEPVNSVKYSSPAPKIMSFGVRVVSAILISLTVNLRIV